MHTVASFNAATPPAWQEEGARKSGALHATVVTGEGCDLGPAVYQPNLLLNAGDVLFLLASRIINLFEHYQLQYYYEAVYLCGRRAEVS